jgi:energy-coupling factor transport system permease protein
MYWLASGFIFRRTDSPFHRLDPRVRLLVSVELFAVSLMSRTIPELAGVIAFMLAVSAVARVLKRVTRTMLLTATFAAFIFAVNIVFTRQVSTSALYAARFVAIVVSTSIFFITTSPDELEQVMKYFHLPRDIVFAFVTAVRFIPVLMLDAMSIMDAQKSRGLELEKGGIVSRVRKMIPVLIPLVVNSVVRSGELAEAMESRAYGAVPRPTSLYEYRTSARDRAVALASVVLFAAAAYSFYFVIPA